MNQKRLNKLRREIQDALIQAKIDSYKEQFGVGEGEYGRPEPEEDDADWIDYFERFDHYLHFSDMTTVWERIGCPEVIPADRLEPADFTRQLRLLLERLWKANILVDFLGNWTPAASYRYLIDELMYEEIEAEPFEDSFTCFTPSTPAYDIEMWVTMFVRGFFAQDLHAVVLNVDFDQFRDNQGNLISETIMKRQLERLWEGMPPIQAVDLIFLRVDVDENHGHADVKISWLEKDNHHWMRSSFDLIRVEICENGWDIVKTSLFEDVKGAFNQNAPPSTTLQ